MGIGLKIGLDIGSKLGRNVEQLSDELLTNYDFSTGLTGWTTSTGITESGGIVTFDASVNNAAYIYQNIPIEYQGKTIRIYYKLDSVLTSGDIRVYNSGTGTYFTLNNVILSSSVGEFEVDVPYDNTGTRLMIRIINAVGTCSIDYVSAKAIL